LGTAPSLAIIRSRFWSAQLGRSLAVEEKNTRTLDTNYYLRGNTGISREEGPGEAKDNSAIEDANGLAGETEAPEFSASCSLAMASTSSISVSINSSEGTRL